MSETSNALESVRRLLAYYRDLGVRALAQVDDADVVWQQTPESNSIAVIVQHLHGNMRSRWTDFLTSDGEKSWRDREGEFRESPHTRDELVTLWNDGWDVVFAALDGLTDDDLGRLVAIRNQDHTVLEAVHRQMTHYAYHTGQLVQLARVRAGAAWQSLSIPRGESAAYNATMFAREQARGHFTEDTR